VGLAHIATIVNIRLTLGQQMVDGSMIRTALFFTTGVPWGWIRRWINGLL